MIASPLRWNSKARLEAFLRAAVSLFGLACAETEDVSVLTVSRQSFRQEVTAEGVLNAVRSTPVSAPVEGGGGPYKIAWLVEDGSFVHEGDVLVRFDASEMELELLEGEIAHATSERKIDQRHAQTEAALSNVDRDRHLAQLELDMAQNFASKDPTIFSRVQIIESEIDQDLAGLKLDHADGREAVEKRTVAIRDRALHHRKTPRDEPYGPGPESTRCARSASAA